MVSFRLCIMTASGKSEHKRKGAQKASTGAIDEPTADKPAD